MRTPTALRLPLVCLAFAVPATLAACGGDDGGDDDGTSPDGSPGDTPDADPGAPDAPVGTGAFGCLGAQMPTTAPATITLAGAADTIGLGGSSPVEGATITAFDASDAQVGTATSAADGAYSISVPTGSAPVDGHVRGVGPKGGGYLDTLLFPPNPLYADTSSARVLLLTSSTFGLLETFGVDQTDTKGFLAVLVLDCNGDPVQGATVTAPDGATVIYTNGNLPDDQAQATDASGAALIFNVEPGSVTVDATYNSMSFREHAVDVVAFNTNTITTTAVAPGPVPPQ
jgi:hypothetical protein